MTEEEIRKIEQQLAVLQSSLNTLTTEQAGIKQKLGDVKDCVTVLGAKRTEWERTQGLGTRKLAAMIGLIATVGATVASAIVTIAVRVIGG